MANLEQHPIETIRHIDCCKLIKSTADRCSACNNYRKSLRALSSKYRRSQVEIATNPDINTQYSFHTREQLTNTVKKLKVDIIKAENKIANLQMKLDESLERIGVKLDETTNSDFVSIMKQHTEQIL